MAKRSKSIAELYEETKSSCTFDDFPVGTRAKVVTPCVDFYFFYGEEGVVTKNDPTKRLYGISLKFDKPRHFEDGYIQEEFSFDPCDLVPLSENGTKFLTPLQKMDDPFTSVEEKIEIGKKALIENKELKEVIKDAYGQMSLTTDLLKAGIE